MFLLYRVSIYLYCNVGLLHSNVVYHNVPYFSTVAVHLVIFSRDMYPCRLIISFKYD